MTPSRTALAPRTRRSRLRRGLATAVAGVVALSGSLVLAAPAEAVNAAHPAVVSDDPVDWTPHIEDGAVLGLTQLNGTVFAVGDFTTVRDQGATSTLSRRSIVAFDATTGRIDRSFAPAVNGTIRSIDTDGEHLFVGGSFSSVNGQTQRRVAKLTTSGALAPGQPAFPNSGVNEVVVRGGTLYVGGGFTSVGGTARSALAALSTQTGAVLSTLDLPFAGTYNGGSTNVKRMDATRDGRTLVAIGNFLTVDGQPREQVVKIDLAGGGAAAAVDSWGTDRFSRALNNCAGVFDSWVRDIDFSPEGEYFVVTTTGAFAGGAGSGTLCDANTRWETAATGAGQQPTWISYTGGDTSYGVAITGSAVYIGGHMRWVNNPFQGDQAGPGAVSREGIVALDPRNGMPFSWNPGRARGVGAQALLATDRGLWVGSDTVRFAGELRSRIAFLPLAGGTTPQTYTAATLPNHLYGISRPGSNGRVLYRVNAGGPVVGSQDGGPDWSADTASTSTLRTSGSSTSTGSVGSLDGTVPAGTPRDLYGTERWDPSGGDEMRWSFPVEAGRSVTVRLYLANSYSGTNDPGERVFDVAVEGTTVLDDLDLSAEAGHQVGTMREATVTSDGTVDIDFLHVVENPLVNAIEILDPAVPDAPAEASLTRRPVDSSGTPTGLSSVVSTSTDWAAARGAFVVGGTMYYGTSTGFFARSFDEGQVGPVREVDLYDDPDDGARIPFPTGSLSGAFFDTVQHRIYYTLTGDPRLYYRYFTPESETVGAQTFVADNGGTDLSTVAGLTYADGRVWFGSGTDGFLRSVPFAAGRLSGTPTVVSADGSWKDRALLVAGPLPSGPNQAPTASFTSSCDGLTCSFDASGSRDGDGTVVGHGWTFGDGAGATGATTTHTYGTAGTYDVELVVTDDDGGTGRTTSAVTVTAPPPAENAAPTASFTVSCTALECSFDASGSADTDGTVVGHAWSFGDGAGATGATATHAYAGPGSYVVGLVVTDDDGATAETSRTVQVQEEDQPAGDVAFRAAQGSVGTWSTVTVDVPGGVQAGDLMLLVVTTNRSTSFGAPTGVTGWGDPVASWSGARDQLQTQVWSRTADGTEGGARVAVGLGATSKYTASVVAYSGAVLGPLTTAAETTSTSAHTTPPVDVVVPGSWLLSFWADKTSSTTDWTPPTGAIARTELVAAGSGRVTSLLADSGGVVPTGTAGGLTATADSATVKAQMASLVLAPAP